MGRGGGGNRVGVRGVPSKDGPTGPRQAGWLATLKASHSRNWIWTQRRSQTGFRYKHGG